MKRVSIYFTAMVILTGVTWSCKNASEKMAEKIIEKSIKQATGEKVDIDYDKDQVTIQTEEGSVKVGTENASWPSGAPSEVPEFTFGKITAVVSSETDEANGWTMGLSRVSADAVDKYNKQLKEKGFKTQVVNMAGVGGTLTGTKEKITVAVMIGEGEGSLSVQVAN